MQPANPITIPGTPAASKPVETSRTSVVLQAAAAIGLGLFVIGMVGFSQVDAFHNAAHDVRHSNAFPCH